MQKLSNQEKWKPWQGIVLQVVYLVLLLTVCSYVQRSWGQFGLVASELIFLATAIAVTLIHKTPLKEVFPVKKIKIVEFIGLLFFAAAAIMTNFICVGISMVLFPNFLGELDGLNEALGGMALVPSVFILAITPAICEEAIMRGALLSHFRGLKKDWPIIVIVGVCFGILHVSVLKFLSTAVLGMALAYLMVKKNNILLPVLVHFFNNLLSAVVSAMSGAVSMDASDALSAINPLQLLGTYMFIGFLAPLFFVIGVKLLNTQKVKTSAWIVSAILTSVLLGGGLLISVMTALNYETVCNYSDEINVVPDGNSVITFTIEEEGSYQVVMSVLLEDNEATISLEDNSLLKDEEYFSEEHSGIVMINKIVELESGDYKVVFRGSSDMQETEVPVVLQIRKVN